MKRRRLKPRRGGGDCEVSVDGWAWNGKGKFMKEEVENKTRSANGKLKYIT